MTVELYWAPTELGEALDHLASGEVTVLAGGTDLMPQKNAGKVTLKRGLLNVRRIAALATITEEGESLRLGALATISEIMRDPLVRRHAGVLVEAGDHFASDQLRNAATIGGNVCNASPAGDMLVPLLALDAQAELAGQRNGRAETRRVPLADFFTGPGRTVRAPHELLCAIHVPLSPPGCVARFFKFGTRPALDISAISIGLAGVRAGDTLTRVRIAYGAVAPTPIRSRAAETALEGAPLSEATIERVAAAARDDVRPIDDVRASAWYRKELVFNMTRRMLTDVAHA